MAVAAADMRHHGRVRDGLERARLGRASLLAWSAIGVMVFAALAFSFDPTRLLTSLGDTDDATRMIEVRAWMSGASWFDLTLPRFGGADPLVSHWSRLIDVPLAGLLLGFELFLPADEAELVVRALWPLLVFWAFESAGTRGADPRRPHGGAAQHSAHRDVHHRHRAVPARAHRPPQRDDPGRGHRHPAARPQLR
jgi:hypothetical protein